MPLPAELRAKDREQGYALLMIFLVAAIVGIGMYAVVPRVAFESQRDKEQLLVSRGEQYKRAIQLYYRKFRRYPAKMEDLDNTNNQRFLRQRYVDPMSGKSEWRLIHIGPGGIFTDSLTQKNNSAKKQGPSSVNNFITELKPMGGVDTGTNPGVNVGLRRRPSDQGGGEGGGDPNAPPPNADPNNPPGGENPNNGANPGAAPNNGQPNADVQTNPNGPPNGMATNNGFVNGNQPNPSNTNSSSGYPNPTGFGNNAASSVYNAGGATGGIYNSGAFNPNAAAGNGNGQPGGNGASGPDVIRNILTSPRPGGPPPGVFNPTGQATNDGYSNGATNQLPTTGNIQPTGGFGSGGSSFGGGANGASMQSGAPGASLGSAGGSFPTGSFAGVASTVERPGIKVYADHKKYNEWEFIYDFGKDTAFGGGNNIPQPNQNQNGLNQNGLNQNGLNQNNSGTGNNTQNGANSSSPGFNSGMSGAGSGNAQPAPTGNPNP